MVVDLGFYARILIIRTNILEVIGVVKLQYVLMDEQVVDVLIYP